ncbi:hybrid signal transduction histidine kinase L [Calliphora vicina]|uniref:hybrid signal transduction histidine kinase L n=1 Tax=Calliphora vicina TaxID=7373 RepID=UPI00325C1947
MKITLAVLFLAGLTIYCKCAAVLSLPPSLIAHAASLDESLKTQKPSLAKNNEIQLQLQGNEDEATNEAALAADLYTNFKNLWHNKEDLSLNLKKRERNTFDDAIVDVAARQQQQQQQQPMATIKQNNKNQNGLKPHDNDNVGHNNNNNNHNNNNHKNENNILKSSLPLWLSSAAANMNEATNLNTPPQLKFPSPKVNSAEEYDDTNDWLSPSSEMIDDIFVSPPHVKIQEPTVHLKRRDLENMPAATEDSAILNRLLRPSKYWSRQCPLENDNNCLQEYYGALIADRNNVLLKQLQYRQNHPFSAVAGSSQNHNNKINDDDDILLLLTAEQNLIRFLSWALRELYPYGKFTNVTANGADSYDPGTYMWKKLNLSGRLEPPLLVDEPRYVIVRREYDQSDEDENDYKRGLNYGGDPFIPPRGRKHNLPDLDSLLQRYETFVPNRGRRDKIKDIFKYDDLFYPNRGKRQMTAAGNDNGVIDERNDDGNDIEAIDEAEINERHEMQQHPLLSNELTEYIENLMAKMKRKLQQPNQQQPDDDEKLANSFDETSNRNEPTTRMSTTFQQAPPAAAVATSASPSLLEKRFKSMINILHNRKQQQQRHQQQHLPNHYNARRQWWKRYTTKANTSSTRPTNSNVRPMQTLRSPTLATNRLQTTLRSMSPLQQLTQLYQQKHQQQQPQQLVDLSPPYIQPASKFMWQQQQNSLKSLAQQFDPLSWHKLQLLLQQQPQYHHGHHQPLLTMRHPRLTALQHLPVIQQQQQLQLATPQETQLTYSNDQLDNSITNDLDNFYNKDLD